jgi:ABC-2 type transport system ATP-binding protein
MRGLQMPTLSFSHLRKTYASTVASDDVTFEVRSGEVFGLLGPNGAGKSTLIRMLMDIIAPDAGDILLDGRPVTPADRDRIGYLPEERGLYRKEKVLDVLIYFGMLKGLERAAARASAHAWLERFGIPEMASRRVDQMSKGQQQKVQIVGTLLHDPSILVLDEPFSGLDPVAVDVMSGVLREKAAAGVPVIFSSHQLELVERISDRVGIIAAGRMVAVGSVDDLRVGDDTVIDVYGPCSTDWTHTVPGVSVLTQSGEHTRVKLDDGIDDQEVLRAALAAGPVHEFSRYRPALTELYRDVVNAPEQADRTPVTV